MKTRMFAVLGLVLASFSALADAAGPDLTALTGAVDFSTVTAAILVVFAAMVPVGLAMKGGSAILRKLGFK